MRLFVAAIREELERFVASHVRMHLAIAERDPLSAHGDRSRPAPTMTRARELLQRFTREFKQPEQIKNYLMKEVIGRLPNASAIDLAHFAGLNPVPNGGQDEEDEAYGDLLAELRRSEPRPARRPYPVESQGGAGRRSMRPARHGFRGGHVPHNAPSPEQTLEIEIDDADGSRRVHPCCRRPGPAGTRSERRGL